MGRRLGRWQEPASLAIGALALAGVLLPPLAAAVLQAVTAPVEAWTAFTQPRLLALLMRSIVLGLAVAASTLMLGVPFGLLLGRSAERGVHFFLFLHAIPLALPPFVTALAAFHVFGRGGWFGSVASSAWLFSPLGLTIVLSVCFTPIITVLTWLGVRATERSGDEAARTIGGPWRTVVRVVLPQARPLITLGAIVVFALTVGELAAPTFLRVDVYSAAVFARLGGFTFSPGEAASLAAPLIILSLVLWVFERRLNADHADMLPRFSQTPAALLDTPTARVWAAAIATLAAIIGAAPLAVMCALALSGGGFALLTRAFAGAALNSLFYAAVTSTLIVGVAVVCMSSTAERPRIMRWMDAAAWLGFLAPPAIIALGLIAFWNAPATQWIYAGAAIVVLALAARFAVLGLRIYMSGLLQLPPSHAEAAQLCGATYWRRLFHMQLKPLATVAACAWLLVFMFSLRDIETTALLYPAGGESLAMRMFALEANGPIPIVAAHATMLGLLTLLPLIAVALLTRLRR